MATKISKPVERETDFTFEGLPIVVTLNPDMTLDIRVKRHFTTNLRINLADVYLKSRHMDGKRGHSRKVFKLEAKQFVVGQKSVEEPPKTLSEIVHTMPLNVTFPPPASESQVAF